MDDLIEALTILRKYLERSEDHCTCCEHDVLYVHLPDREKVSKADVARLEELGFEPDEDLETAYRSSRFGSC